MNELRGSIFIVTYGRSGSTLLQRILQTIPGSCIRGENHGAINALYRLYARARSTRDFFGHTETRECDPWYGADLVQPEEFARGIVQAFIAHVLCPPKGTRWLGFKEIRYSGLGDEFADCMDFILSSFPNAFLVFNTRSADAVAKSGWNAREAEDKVKQMVSRMDDRFSEFQVQNPERTFIAHHEKTISEPAYLRGLFEAVDEPFDLDGISAILNERLDH